MNEFITFIIFLTIVMLICVVIGYVMGYVKGIKATGKEYQEIIDEYKKNVDHAIDLLHRNQEFTDKVVKELIEKEVNQNE